MVRDHSAAPAAGPEPGATAGASWPRRGPCPPAPGPAAATEHKLANPSFIERAPEAVVARSRERLAAAQAEIARLEQRLAALPGSG